MSGARTLLKLTVVVFLSAMLSACGQSSMEGIIVAGSTSVQPYAEILAEDYAHDFPELEVDVQGGGSSSGITAAESGAADIGMSSRALNEAESGLFSFEIAKDGLALIVHPDNPIENISLDQIRRVYAAEIVNWSELGGHSANIHLIAREEGSGTRSAFADLVMGKTEITPKAIVQDSNGAVKQLVVGDINAVGFISLGLVDSTVKAVKIEGIMPTKENVMNGSYSLFRPFLFVTADKPSGLAKQFIDFTLSDKGQQILLSEGLIPITEGMKP